MTAVPSIFCDECGAEARFGPANCPRCSATLPRMTASQEPPPDSVPSSHRRSIVHKGAFALGVLLVGTVTLATILLTPSGNHASRAKGSTTASGRVMTEPDQDAAKGYRPTR